MEIDVVPADVEGVVRVAASAYLSDGNSQAVKGGDFPSAVEGHPRNIQLVGQAAAVYVGRQCADDGGLVAAVPGAMELEATVATASWEQRQDLLQAMLENRSNAPVAC